MKLNSTEMTAKQSASGVNIVCASSDLKHAEWEERIARLEQLDIAEALASRIDAPRGQTQDKGGVR